MKTGQGGAGDRDRRSCRQGKEELETGTGGAEDRDRRRETETGGDGTQGPEKMEIWRKGAGHGRA